MYYLIHMTFRLCRKSQTFAIQQLLYWYIKCKNGSSKTSISILYTFFFPRGFLPHLYHLFSSLLEHLTLLFSLPPILNGLFLDLLVSVLDFKGMQQLIWAGSYICKKKTKPTLNYFTSFFFHYWFTYTALPDQFDRTWLCAPCSEEQKTTRLRTAKKVLFKASGV